MELFALTTYLSVMSLRHQFPTLYFSPKAFPEVAVLQHNWKTISSESSKLPSNLIRSEGRSYNTWYGSKAMENLIPMYEKSHGWINGWSVDKTPNPKWLNWGLVYNGKFLGKNASLCPKTVQILSSLLPHIRVAGFSLMKPNSVIKPHTDSTGIRYNSLAYHLGLSVPNKCGMQVLKQRVTERDGFCFMFDASYLHYAFNHSNKDRIILYVDFDISSLQNTRI